VVAVDAGLVVGPVPAASYLHPDKERAELWINEVGVAPTHRRRGLARQLLVCLFEQGRQTRRREARLLTEHDNEPAKGLYGSLGGVAAEQVMFSFQIGSG